MAFLDASILKRVLSYLENNYKVLELEVTNCNLNDNFKLIKLIKHKFKLPIQIRYCNWIDVFEKVAKGYIDMYRYYCLNDRYDGSFIFSDPIKEVLSISLNKGPILRNSYEEHDRMFFYYLEEKLLVITYNKKNSKKKNKEGYYRGIYTIRFENEYLSRKLGVPMYLSPNNEGRCKKWIDVFSTVVSFKIDFTINYGQTKLGDLKGDVTELKNLGIKNTICK